jgi:hypothetical protein
MLLKIINNLTAIWSVLNSPVYVRVKARKKLRLRLWNKFERMPTGAVFGHRHKVISADLDRDREKPLSPCLERTEYNTLDLDILVRVVCTLKLQHVKCMLTSYSDSSLPYKLSIIR